MIYPRVRPYPKSSQPLVPNVSISSLRSFNRITMAFFTIMNNIKNFVIPFSPIVLSRRKISWPMSLMSPAFHNLKTTSPLFFYSIGFEKSLTLLPNIMLTGFLQKNRDLYCLFKMFRIHNRTSPV